MVCASRDAGGARGGAREGEVQPRARVRRTIFPVQRFLLSRLVVYIIIYAL